MENSDELIQHLNDIKGRLGSNQELKENLLELQSNINQVVNDLESLSISYENLEEDFDKVENRVREIEQVIAESNLTDVSTELDALKSRLSEMRLKIESKVGGDELKERVSKFGNDVESVEHILSNKVSWRAFLAFGSVIGFAIIVLVTVMQILL